MSDNEQKFDFDQGTEITVFDQVKRELDIQRDPMEFKVPLSDIFGKTSLAPKASFGQVTFKENIDKVDQALANVGDLQNIWNHSHTQWMWKHINLSWLSPHKNMRQISAEVSRKKGALNEAKWKHIQNELKIKKIEEELSKPEQLTKWREIELNIKLAQMREGLAEGATHIEGAMKDILALNEIYEQLKARLSDFSEEDIEAEEQKHT